MYILCICVHASAYGVQKRVSDPPGASTAGGQKWFKVGGWNQILIFCKNSWNHAFILFYWDRVSPGTCYQTRQALNQQRSTCFFQDQRRVPLCPHNTWHFYTAKECFGMITGSNYPWAKSCQQILRAEGREIDVREPRETQLYLLMGRCPQSSLKLQVESSHGISKAWQTTLKAMCEHWRRSASSKHQASLSYYLHCDSEPLLWTFHKDQEEKYLKGRFSPPWFGTARKVALLPWICCPPQEYL